jgi:cyclophilin family peptidyl-prolyl cis-trans isomerase
MRRHTPVAKTATIETSKGTIVADLFDSETPTVANFEKLATRSSTMAPGFTV